MSKLTEINEPLILLPLKLEIRKISTSSSERITLSKYNYKDVQTEISSPKSTVKLPPGYQEPEDILLKNPLREGLNEYWIRWYPDELNLKSPVGEVTKEEWQQWDKFRKLYNSNKKLLPGDISEGKVQRAWIQFTEEVGIARAIQILRIKEDETAEGEGKDWDFDTDMNDKEPMDIAAEKGIQMPSLPQEIFLFTVENGGVELLKQVKINKEIVAAFVDLQNGHWMSDFDQAVKKGMGIIITDPNKVRQLKNAEWLIAFGINEFDNPDLDAQEKKYYEEELGSRNILTNLLKRRNALGELSLVPQDIPTNNTEQEKTKYEELEENPEEYLGETRGGVSDESIPSTIDGLCKKNNTDLHLLTQYLNLPIDIFQGIFNNSKSEKVQSIMMSTLLWDTCTLLGKLNGQNYSLLNEHWDDLRDFFIHNVAASGPFPVLRVGNNPYGILPVMANERNLDSLDLSSNDFKRNLQLFLLFLKNQFLRLSDSTPKLDGVEGDKYDTLINILRTSSTSKEIDIRNLSWVIDQFDYSKDPESFSNNLILPQAAEDIKESKDLDYLLSLADIDLKQIGEMELINPTDKDPLLKILINYAILHFNRIVNNENRNSIVNIFKNIKTAAKYFINPDSSVSVKRFETLLLETFDLLTFRLDSWITGQAFKQLKTYDNDVAPPIGVYGFLEKPGDIQDNEVMPEYIQTPSEAHAVTASLLRNASIHNGTDNNQGAFQVNLSSDQVRKGLDYFEGLRTGYLPEELLGYRIERMIHDDPAINDSEIFNLRQNYPLSNQFSEGESEVDTISKPSIIHGEDFLEKEDHSSFVKIKDEIRKIKDAAADISLAEVVHSTLNGNIAKASAWMDFMDGNNIPPEPEFVKSRRTGLTQNTKIFLPVETPDNLTPDTSNIRRIADPIFAHFCESFMPNFDNMVIACKIAVKGAEINDDSEPIHIPISELIIAPVDLVLGGKEEIIIRLRYYLLTRWKEPIVDEVIEEEPTNPLKPLTIENTGEFAPYPNFLDTSELLNEEIISIHWDVQNSISEFFPIAEKINSIFHRGQTDGELTSITPLEFPLTSNKYSWHEIDWIKTYETLIERATKLRKGLKLTIQSIKSSDYDQIKDIHLEVVKSALNCRKDLLNLKESYENGNDIKTNLRDDLLVSVQAMLIIDEVFKEHENGDGLISYIDNIIQNYDDIEISQSLDELRNHIGTMLESYETNVTETAHDFIQSLKSNSPSIADKVSFWGQFRALLPLPARPNFKELNKIIDIWDNIILNLSEKNNGVYEKIEKIKLHKNAIKLCIQYMKEIHNIIISDLSVAQKIESILKLDFEDITESEEQKHEIANLILSFRFEDIIQFNEDIFFKERVLSQLKTGISKANKIIQDLSDKEGIAVLTPFTLKSNGYSDSRKWAIDFSVMDKEDWGSYLSDYAHVRNDIKNIYTLYKKLFREKPDEDGEIDNILFKDQKHEHDTEFRIIEKEDDSDYYYLSPKSILKPKWFTCIVVDEWSEFYPNRDETTGLAVRYNNPTVEAPNVILVPVPPDNSTKWTPKILAETIKETIDLMQIRMISTRDLISDNNLGRFFPFLSFMPPGKDKRTFPTQSKNLINVFSEEFYFTTRPEE